MRAPIRTAAALAIGATVAWSGGARADVTPLQVWRRSITQGEAVPFSGRMSLTIWQGGHTVATVGHIEQAAPGRYRLQYDTPPEAHGRIVWANGPQQWQYEPRRQRLTRRDATQPADGARTASMRLIERNYRIVMVAPLEHLAGRPAVVIDLVPKHAGKSRVRQWIDQRTYKALRVETRYADGTVARIVAYGQVTIPAAVPASALTPVVPPSTRTVYAPAPADAVAPAEVAVAARRFGLDDDGPDGFQLVQARETGAPGSRVAQFIYSDGLETVSVFVKAGGPASRPAPLHWRRFDIGGVPAFRSATAHAAWVTWYRRGHRYTAVSHLDLAALGAFARHQVDPEAAAQARK